jgi:DNA-binding NarL/FixJ family response regulator
MLRVNVSDQNAKKDKSQNRVYVISTTPLFIQLIRLLLDHPGVTIVGETSNHEDAWQEIFELHPDSILIEAVNAQEGEESLRLLKSSVWDMQIILISLDDNHLERYCRQEIVVSQAQDLLLLIRKEELNSQGFITDAV